MQVVLKEVVDLENIPVGEVFENLRCNKERFFAESAQQMLELSGYNKLKEKKHQGTGHLVYKGDLVRWLDALVRDSFMCYSTKVR
ncbi:hypothetical protein RHGRI_017134 [Rhododendron griersonianum]|uniref:Uncharacterized protein n=1 Tax=Rhododendron griersonianum TaxID=479676 RepID=A0AAV6JWP3_9ERIC|nr:hypothetical protein RHGRI_017134 [Rhododendron griersonianum]